MKPTSYLFVSIYIVTPFGSPYEPTEFRVSISNIIESYRHSTMFARNWQDVMDLISAINPARVIVKDWTTR